MTAEQYRVWREGLDGWSPVVAETIGALKPKAAVALASELHPGIRWASGAEAKRQLVKETDDWLFSRDRVNQILAF